jgi:single-stranded-DNA-specific exonuclease
MTYAPPISSQLKPPRTPLPHREAARWKVKTSVCEADERVAAACGISAVTAAILRTRGHDSSDAVLSFLTPDRCGLHDPMLLPDAAPAIARLQQAITSKEPMLVYGDYDVDGITSTALLVRSLRSLGATVDWKIPERKGEGYGMNVGAINEAAERGVKFILTADCGVRDIEPALRAKELSIDLVITDHHEPGTELPEAIAVVNPKRADSEYPFDELSGCGVAFKLMQGLMKMHYPRHVHSFCDRFVDFVGMAAIADCVPLVDENRILAYDGLRRLASTQKLGLQALMRVAGVKISGDSLRGSQIGFALGPRLNAVGRLDSATKGLQLLMSMDAIECEALALELDKHNLARRELQNRILDEATAVVHSEVDLVNDMAIVIAGAGWHGGVMGLVAGRLAERYGRPTIVLNLDGGIAHGSGRSAAGFNLHSAVEATRDLLIRGGGHEAACGMSLSEENYAEFRERVLQCAREQLTAADLVPTVEADVEVHGSDLSTQLVRDLEKLEPCGIGNPEALLVLRGAQIIDGKSMGKNGEHLKWFINANGARFEAVWWRPGERAAGFQAGKMADLCFVPELNEWNGQTRLQLVIKAARPAD